MRGFAENAICPECRGYRLARIVKRGVRQCCECDTVYNLRDVTRIVHGKVIYPPFKEPEVSV